MQLHKFTCALFNLGVSYKACGLDYRKNTIRFSVKCLFKEIKVNEGDSRLCTTHSASIGWHRMLFAGHKSILLIASDSSPVSPSISPFLFLLFQFMCARMWKKVHGLPVTMSAYSQGCICPFDVSIGNGEWGCCFHTSLAVLDGDSESHPETTGVCACAEWVIVFWKNQEWFRQCPPMTT